jgi:hypothetical protein
VVECPPNYIWDSNKDELKTFLSGLRGVFKTGVNA